MFGYLKLRWKLWKLRRVWDLTDEANTSRKEEAKKPKAPRDQLREIEQDGVLDYFEYQDSVRAAHTKYLLMTASQLIVPIPSPEEKAMWEESHAGRRDLTELGINTVRAAVRAERKARLEMFLMWVPGVVGILGALIGLVSVFFGKK